MAVAGGKSTGAGECIEGESFDVLTRATRYVSQRAVHLDCERQSRGGMMLVWEDPRVEVAFLCLDAVDILCVHAEEPVLTSNAIHR